MAKHSRTKPDARVIKPREETSSLDIELTNIFLSWTDERKGGNSITLIYSIDLWKVAAGTHYIIVIYLRAGRNFLEETVKWSPAESDVDEIRFCHFFRSLYFFFLRILPSAFFFGPRTSKRANTLYPQTNVSIITIIIDKHLMFN